ncbi:hypothetical protein [Bordetella sp. N]|uniref:hypothetical protein n=1 Tax=Bordetella sp. N TaxID=1746199 RepID=UPI0007092432|nr:hypothetical protein [Bordetella sp. N]ALM84413.1 hypothetical protein ASB57_16825 [Bordetella sp. N]
MVDTSVPRLAAVSSKDPAPDFADAEDLPAWYAAMPPVFIIYDDFESVPPTTAAFDEDLRTHLDDLVVHMGKLVLKRIEVIHRVGMVYFAEAAAPARALAQYLVNKGIKRGEIRVVADYSPDQPPPGDPGKAGALEVRVAGMLPEPPRRARGLWALPPVLLKSLPDGTQPIDAGTVRRLDHAVRDFRETGVTRVEISIVSPMIEEDGISLGRLSRAYLLTAHLIKEALITRGLDPSSVFIKPLPNLSLTQARAPVGDTYGVLIQAWASQPDPTPRLRFSEGYLPDLSATAPYA